MIKFSLHELMNVAAWMTSISTNFYMASQTPENPLKEHEIQDLVRQLKELQKHCRNFELPVSAEAIERALSDLPKNDREIEMLMGVVESEIKSRLFIFVPAERARYFQSSSLLSDNATRAFPKASWELVQAGNCYAASLDTACVFHSMRAAEIGVRCLGTALGVSFPNYPIELAEWQNILEQVESKIAAMKAMPRGQIKDEQLKFYSQAAVQFRYFKDAWRVRVAHARETFDGSQALQVLEHTRDFFESLAARIRRAARGAAPLKDFSAAWLPRSGAAC